MAPKVCLVLYTVRNYAPKICAPKIILFSVKKFRRVKINNSEFTRRNKIVFKTIGT